MLRVAAGVAAAVRDNALHQRCASWRHPCDEGAAEHVEDQSERKKPCADPPADMVRLLARAEFTASCAQAGHTALHAAAGCGHTEAVKFLLGLRGIDVNPRDKVRMP